MSINELEEQFEQSETKRRLVEHKKNNPNMLDEATLKAVTTTFIENFKRLDGDLEKTLVDAKETLQKTIDFYDVQTQIKAITKESVVMKTNLAVIMENVDGLLNLLIELNNRLAKLEEKIIDEQGENAVQRQRETETLQNIDNYLKNWRY